MCQDLVLGQSQVLVRQARAYATILLTSIRHSPSHRRINFKTGESKRPSQPRRGGLAPEAEAEEEGEETP
eukprot:6307681-Ditylum_brightwellii.AAC.1